MRISVCILIAVSVLFFLKPAIAQGTLTDPYEIMQKSFQAQRNAENPEAHKSQYFEGSMVIQGAGMEGTIKNWKQFPLRSRVETDLKFFKQIQGYNGQVEWVKDTNGKVNIQKDENSLKRKKIEELSDDADNFKPGSPYFKLEFKGIEKVGTTDCYVIDITNTINQDKQTCYIDTTGFLVLKTCDIQPDSRQNTLFSDYRDVNGEKYPFKIDLEYLPIGQKITITIAKYETGISIEPSIFEVPVQDAGDFQFLKGDRSEDVPFKLIENHLYLPVTINGQEKVWCLDTGAEMSVIDTGYAAELGLTAEGNIKGSGVSKTVNVSFVTLPAYNAAGIQFKPQKIAAVEIKKLFKYYMGLDAVGVLGYDFLSRFITKIDFANEKISFYHPDHFNYNGPGQVLSAPLKNNIFTVPMSVDGKYSGMWSLDIGAGSTSFHYPFAEENGFLKLPGVDRLGSGAGGNFHEKFVRFRELELAGFIIPKPVIGFPTENVEGAFRVKERIGNLGNDVLKHFVLYLDYKNQRVILEKGKDFDRDFPRDRSGLMLLATDEDNLVVFYISAGSPAASAGFQKGDIVTSIDGKKISELGGILGVRDLFREKVGTVYNIETRRGNEVKKLVLTLKELI